MNAAENEFTDDSGSLYPWPPTTGWSIQSYEVIDDEDNDDPYPDGDGDGDQGGDQWETDAVEAADDEPLHTIISILRFFNKNAKSVMILKAQLREEYEVGVNSHNDKEIVRLCAWVKEFVTRGSKGSTKTGRLPRML